MEKKQIESREDIELLVDSFYKKVVKDDLIEPIFTKVAHFDWEVHIPIMYNFWETLLFHKGGYRGNPVLKHIELDVKVRLLPAHFERWRVLFFQTLDHYFEGDKVKMAKEKIKMMEKLMLFKLDASRGDFFIQ